MVEFIEAPLFTRYLRDYLTDDGYCAVQQALAANPEAGDIMQGTGGARKLRWRHSGRSKGTRGGLRIVYYAFPEQIWLITLYSKDEMDDLTEKEKRLLRAAVQVEKAARKRGT